MFGMTENANTSLIFPEIALNHCSPNVNSPPHQIGFFFLQPDFYQAQVDSVSKHMADGWVSNTSQEDPPDSTSPAPLEPLDSTTPRHSLLMDTQSPWLSFRGRAQLQGELTRTAVLCRGRRTKAGKT